MGNTNSERAGKSGVAERAAESVLVAERANQVTFLRFGDTVMSLLKQYKLAEKAAARQQRIILELQGIAKSVEGCEKTIIDLKAEPEAVNVKHQSRKTTEEDIACLTDLLKCANKKLGWEKQLASLRKRAPAVLQNVSTLMQDPKNPPSEEMRAAMVQALQDVKVAMERLEKVRMD